MTANADSLDLMDRLDHLGTYTEEAGKLTRLFLSEAHREAADQVADWMRMAGMSVHMDAAATIVGRYEADQPDARTLLIGSHIDTVRDGGLYDGALGVLVGVEVVRRLNEAGKRLPFAIEILAFGDEEGVRFPSTMTGSRALVGTVTDDHLGNRDDENVVLGEALDAFGGNAGAVKSIARRPDDILAYLEVHIEQGPVLEQRDLPIGIVTAINGASRLNVEIDGVAGHAGTVPMELRRDALAAASEIVLAVEQRARQEADIVATVGILRPEPGAINVIPGRTSLSVDLRAPDDDQRARALADIKASAEAIAARRGVSISIRHTFDANAAPCDAAIMDGLDRAIGARQISPHRLPSGAGHDAMTMAALCPIGMLFVRCKDGISHNPAESIRADDAEVAVSVLTDFVENFR